MGVGRRLETFAGDFCWRLLLELKLKLKMSEGSTTFFKPSMGSYLSSGTTMMVELVDRHPRFGRSLQKDTSVRVVGTWYLVPGIW